MRYYKYSDMSIDDAVICGDLTSQEVHKQIETVIGDSQIDVLVG